jgi:LmbE family N-acetylglucosaminyl deacetylase
MPSIPPGPLLLVSPHLDDAVFSCEALVGRAEPLDVLTVFTGLPDPAQRGWWDLECGFEDSTEGMTARREEDAAAFAGTPHRRSYLDLLERQHAPRGDPRARARVAEEVGRWIGAKPNGTVALPAGAGCPTDRLARWLRRLRRERCSPPQHPDHVLVRDAALSAPREETANVLLYEEIPYLLGHPADREVARVASGRHIEPIAVEIDRTRKARRIAAYASQIPHISPAEGRLDEGRTLPAHERYWLLRPASSR